MKRLHPDTLATLPGHIARPRYDRTALGAAIVHLGAGAFQRAHLAAATEAALHAQGDLRWGITGVSLRSADVAQALRPQQGLYTLALRDADASGAPRELLQVIGAMPRLLVAPHSPTRVLDAIANPATRIVSLTVTEKGYHHAPASRKLRLDDVDIEHDLRNPQAPRTTIGLLVFGLNQRRASGHGPVTLLSCDNLPSNGATLRALLLEFSARVNKGLHDWVGTTCSFPNSMVDRIVPRCTTADRSRISAALGVDDAASVIAEPFFDCVIEERFVAGRPVWEAAGARFVADAQPFERAKLRLVNGAHSAIAYLGALAGWATVDEAMRQPELHRFLDRLMREEIAPTLASQTGFDLDAYRERLLRRFANPALQHRTQQIAMDGSQKIPQRWLSTLRDRLAVGAPIDLLGLALAAWLHYLRGVDESGRGFAIDDPLASELARLVGHAEGAAGDIERAARLCAFRPVFGELGEEPRLITAVARSLSMLRARGVRQTLLAA